MANRVRFRARGLAALVGKITVKHTNSSEGAGGRKTYTLETQNLQQVSQNAGSHRRRKA